MAAKETEKALIPIQSDVTQLTEKVIAVADNESMISLTDEFKLLMLKKELLRLVKLYEFSELADSEIGRRLASNPERLKASELVEFSRLLQDAINRINVQMSMFSETADIVKNAATNKVTIVQNNINLSSVKEREKVRLAAESIMSILAAPVDESIVADDDTSAAEKAALLNILDNEE